MLPHELMQFPKNKMILLYGGIPPIIGNKIFFFKNRFFKKRAFPPPEVQAIPKSTPSAEPPPQFREMTAAEASGHLTRPMKQEDISTKDCPSAFADLVTINHNGKVTGILEEGDEYG